MPNRDIESDLFFDSLIESYVTNPRFIERDWLERHVLEGLADPERPFLLITAEPGSGKTGELAWLARRNPNWPRYFIRSNQIAPKGPTGAQSFLFRIGLQLAARYPKVFTVERIRITVAQRVGRLQKDASLIAAEIKELIVSPFVTAAVSITQQVGEAHGNVIGLHVDKLIAEPSSIPRSVLQCLALADPAARISEDSPGELVVVLIDALDEVRHQQQPDSLLNWLEDCPDLPSNVRLVITSRPDDDLLRVFRARQRTRIQEIPLDYRSPKIKEFIEADLRAYAARLAATPVVESTLSSAGETPADFVDAAVIKADGNLGYLDAVGRAIDAASAANDADTLREIVALSGLPAGLRQLYGFFLHQLKRRVGDRSVSVEDPNSHDLRYVSEWSELYIPIVGLLTVAAEPLTATQIRSLATIQPGDQDLFRALNGLGQFLDEGDGRHRFYHATVQEFLGDPATANDPETRELYQDRVYWNGRIAMSYRRATGGWKHANWNALDAYGWRHLTTHLSEASKATRFAELFELYSAGYLGAKRKWVVAAAELQDDWRIVLEAAREIGDFETFVRFGYEISTQFTRVAHLQTPTAARTAVRLAIRRGDEQALRRIASEVALITHPLARAGAQQSLLSELIAAVPQSELIPGLLSAIETLLPAMDPGIERDTARVSYVESLARLNRSGWEQRAQEVLADTAHLPSRLRLLWILAGADARVGRNAEAAKTVARAIAECAAFDTGDEMENLIPTLLHHGLGYQRIDPLTSLQYGLGWAIRSASVLKEKDCGHAIRAVRKQFPRLRNPRAQLQMEIFIFEVLNGAGYTGLAKRLIIPVLDTAIAEDQYLLMLLATAVTLGDTERVDKIKSQLLRAAAETSERELLSMMASIMSCPLETRGVWDVMAPLLGSIEQRCRGIEGGKGLLVFGPALARAHATAGDVAHAHELLEYLLGQLPEIRVRIFDEQPELILGGRVYTPPEKHREEAAWFENVWRAACEVGDRPLISRTLDWLFKAVPAAVTRTEEADFWADAIADVNAVSDANTAEEALGRLAMQLVESRDALLYHVTALLQLAEAWAELGNPEESLRLVNCALEWRPILSPDVRIRILVRACHLRARVGDVAGCRALIEEAIPLVDSIEGPNIREVVVSTIAQGIGALANAGERGRAAAAPLVADLIIIAREIDQGEFSLAAESAVVHAAGDAGIEVNTTELAAAANRYLEGLTHIEFRPLLNAVSALAAAGRSGHAEASSADSGILEQPSSERAARDLFQKLQQKLDDFSVNSDWERTEICQAYAGLIDLGRSIEFSIPAMDWSSRCAREAASVSEPDCRVSSCAAIARMEASLARSKQALDWLDDAIVASSHLAEVYEIQRAANKIFEVWEAIPDIEVRYREIPSLCSLIWRLPDAEERDSFVARTAVAMWSDAQKLAEFTGRIVTSRGVEVVFDAMKGSASLPSGVAPGILYDLLIMCARQPRPIFAGQALAAAQAAVHHRTFPSDMLASALRRIERMIYEIAEAAGMEREKEVQMEPITALVTMAVNVLTPYVVKGAEEFAKAAGKEAYEAAKEVYACVKKWFSGDVEASGVLALFENKPERYGNAMSDVLQERLHANQEFALELRGKLDAAAPYIKVVQKIAEVERATGVEVEEATAGTFDIQQDLGTAKEAAGFKAKHVGRT